MTRPTRLDQDNHRLARLPSCVTPVNTLTSLDQVPRPPPTPTAPEGAASATDEGGG